MNIMRCVAIAALAVVGGCDAPTAARPGFAYDPTTLSRGVLYRWPSGRTIRVWVADENATTVSSLGLATRQAIVAWNAVPSFGEFVLTSVPQSAGAVVG